MLKIKNNILYILHLTDKSFFCFIRNFLEYIFFNQKFSLKYFNNKYLRKYNNLNIYFPHKIRTIMYGRGYNFRLKTLANDYFINKITFNEGDTIVDCGANIGEIYLYFKILQNINIDYYAFEPSINEFECLSLNVKSKYLYNKALWNKNENLEFYIKSNSADSSIFEINNYEKKINIKGVRLDSLNFNNIKLLKIEAEGAEPEVLEGAEDILNKCEYVVIDSGPERGKELKETSVSVINFLVKRNFKLININHNRIVLLFKKNI